MRSCVRVLRVAGLGIALSAGLAAAQMPTNVAQKALGFRIPQYDEDGHLKSQIVGEEANMLPGGGTELKNVRLEFYRDGKVEVTVTTPLCFFDRQANAVSSESPIRVESANVVITGMGLRWNGKDENVTILDQVKVVFQNIKGWFAHDFRKDAR